MTCFYEILTGNKPRPIQPIIQSAGPYYVMVTASNQSLIFTEPPDLVSFPLWVNRYLDYHCPSKTLKVQEEFFTKHVEPAIQKKIGDLKYTAPLICLVSDDWRDTFPSEFLLGEWMSR